MFIPIPAFRPTKTPQQLAADLMDYVHGLIPGDSDQAHDDRCACAVAIHEGADVYEKLIQLGYLN